MNKRFFKSFEFYYLTIAMWVVLIAIALASCGGQDTQYNTNEASGVGVYPSVTRFIDNEASVVCWVYGAAYQGGISCLPLFDTELANTGR